MANAIQKTETGTKVTPVRLDYIRHLMSQNEKPFTPHFVPRTSEKTKQIIYQSLKHQGAMDKELTLQGHLVKRWNMAGKSSNIDNNMAPGKLHESWVPSAISNLWMVVHRS